MLTAVGIQLHWEKYFQVKSRTDQYDSRKIYMLRVELLSKSFGNLVVGLSVLIGKKRLFELRY